MIGSITRPPIFIPAEIQIQQVMKISVRSAFTRRSDAGAITPHKRTFPVVQSKNMLQFHAV
jgi:hypothetical protein